MAERVRSQVEAFDFTKNNPGLSLTTSIGVTVFGFNEALEVTVSRADEMVYKAKAEGRNCVRSVTAPLNIAVVNRANIDRAS